MKELKLIKPFGYPNEYVTSVVTYTTAPYHTLRVTATQFNITATQTQIGVIATSPKTGVLDRVIFNVYSVSTNGNVRVQIRNITATGTPNTILAEVTVNIDSIGTKTATFPTPVSLSMGTPFAVTFQRSSGVYNISATNREAGSPGFPYIVYGNTWTKYIYLTPFLLLSYDGVLTKFPFSYNQSMEESRVVFDSGTTPDEYGNIFELPISCITTGVYASVDYNLAGKFILYDSDSNIIDEIITDPDYISRATGGTVFVNWNKAITLRKKTKYRVTFQPSVTGTDTIMGRFVYTSMDERNTFIPMGENLQIEGTSRVNAGTWTETPLTINAIGVLIDTLIIPTQSVTIF